MLQSLEAASRAQAPLIDSALASVDRQANALAMVSVKDRVSGIMEIISSLQADVAIRNVLALYDSAVQASAYQVREGAGEREVTVARSAGSSSLRASSTAANAAGATPTAVWT